MSETKKLREGPVWRFFRKDWIYPVCCDIPEDKTNHAAMIANIEANPGTLKVEDSEGNILWER